MYLMVLRRPGLCATCQTTLTDVSGASDVLDASSAVCRFPRDCLIGHAAMMTGANAADDMLGTQCGTHGALHRAPTLVSPYCWTGEQPEGPVQSSVSALGRGGAISRSHEAPGGGGRHARGIRHGGSAVGAGLDIGEDGACARVSADYCSCEYVRHTTLVRLRLGAPSEVRLAVRAKAHMPQGRASG